MEEKLKEKVLEVIKRYPDGIKPTEIAEVLGVPETKVIYECKILLQDGRIKKEGLLYCPLE